MTATEILIHDRDDLRPGDVMRVWPKENPERWAEGPIWQDEAGGWHVGSRYICWSERDWSEVYNFDLAKHPARRPVPPVDDADVYALTALLKQSNSKNTRGLYSTLARRLLETGRIEVKP